MIKQRRAAAQHRFHQEAREQRCTACDDQHRAAAITVARPGSQGSRDGHEDDGYAQHAEEIGARDAELGDAVGKREHRGDVEQRVAHHHQQCAQHQRFRMVGEQRRQWQLHRRMRFQRLGEHRRLSSLSRT